MYLIVANLWKLALPFVIAQRIIGNKLAINKCCCRYLWGLIIFMEGKESIYSTGQKHITTEAFWSEEEEEILAFIAADMHQDARAWEAIWQKDDDDRKQPTLDISPVPEDTEIDIPDDIASISETSDLRSTSKASEGEILLGSHEPRPELTHRWSGEDETWDSMISYIRIRCEEDNEMEDVRTVTGDVNIEGIISSERTANIHDATKDAIQQRMSIANLL